MEFLLISFGFVLASYSVIGNDALQTLGTFLNSNDDHFPWWILWGFAGLILSFVLIYSWIVNGGDVSYGRLSHIPRAEVIQWYHVAPPLILLFLTKFGIPVSTTFLVLSIFTPGFLLAKIVFKSIIGYLIAFTSAVLVWLVISKKFEKKYIKTEITKKRWIVAQWITTGFLWSQWLIQDMANIYVYMPRQISLVSLLVTLLAILLIMAVIFRSKGGKIQKIVKSKTNTKDLRSATLIDGLYGLILLVFKELSNLPMSTTWVFLGVLAGREHMINHCLNKNTFRQTFRGTLLDISKATLGLIISVFIILILKQMD